MLISLHYLTHTKHAHHSSGVNFDWYEPFKRFYPMLNEYGVFDTLEDVTEFKKAYDVAFEKGDIGDGDMDTYICRVYEVKEKQRKKKNEK